jgi:HK97 family phage major capsid protein/HK97 family phage prohead protease
MANVNGTDIDLMPTDGMRTEAERYRAWKADGEPGGTEVAATRASQILSGDELSPDTVITMAAWFARHEVDKAGEGFSPGEDGYPSPGRVAWAAWGGDPGQTWADAKAARIKAARDERGMKCEATATVERQPVHGLMELRELNSQPLRRVASFDYATAGRGMKPDDDDRRTLEFSFSSEAPVDRWFGPEVLSHAEGALDMSRLNDGAPLLWNHDPDRVLGVVERAWLDDGRGMVAVRFSRSAFAEEKYGEIRDGILRNVSVGYSIADAQPMRANGQDGILATSWQAHEVSIVSLPADQSVGIGRSLDNDQSAAPAATNPLPPQPMEPQLDIEAVRAQAAADERTRVAGITSLCREHGADDLAQGLIERGATETEAMRDVLAAIGQRAKQPAQPAAPAARPIASGGSADIGLSDKEVRQFSFLKAIRAQLMPGDRAAQDAAAFERECSAAVEQRTGQQARGMWVPHDVLRRDLQVSSASAAGDLVFTDARPGSFIEQLRNRLALTTLGMTTLTGLQGPVAIPRKTGASTAYWLAEGGAPTGSNPTVDQVTMTPRTCGAYVDFTRRLMLQSSLDVETMVRADLVETLALEIERVGLYGLGASGEPQGLKFTTGINTEDFNADSPTYVELVSMETKVNADNADIGAMQYLTNSTRFGAFKTTSKIGSEAQFVLEPGGTVNGYPVVRSNQVATGDVFFGVWNQLLLGLWSGIDLTVDTAALATSGGVRVIALQDLDFAVRHPEAFCRGNNTL